MFPEPQNPFLVMLSYGRKHWGTSTYLLGLPCIQSILSLLSCGVLGLCGAIHRCCPFSNQSSPHCTKESIGDSHENMASVRRHAQYNHHAVLCCFCCATCLITRMFWSEQVGSARLFKGRIAFPLLAETVADVRSACEEGNPAALAAVQSVEVHCCTTALCRIC